MYNAACRVCLALALGVLGISCSDRGQPSAATVTHLSSPELEGLDLPFSEAARVGNMLYLSGQIGNRPGTTELVAGGIAEETRQTMENIRAVLERHGSSMDRVVKCTIYLADIDDWPRMNEVYARFFSDSKPARSAVAGSGLAINARVEIECIAVVDGI